MQLVLPLLQLRKSNLWLWQEVGNIWATATRRRVKESSHGHREEQGRCVGGVMDSLSMCDASARNT